MTRKAGGVKEDAKVILAGGLAGLLVCGGLTAFWFYDGYRKVWQPYRHFEKASCRVLEAGLKSFEKDSEGGQLFAPRFQLSVLEADSLTVGYDLWSEGLRRPEAEKVLASYPAGRDLVCWHPPGRPQEAVLSRKPDVYWILCGAFFVPLTVLFLLMTGFGITLWPRRRARI